MLKWSRIGVLLLLRNCPLVVVPFFCADGGRRGRMRFGFVLVHEKVIVIYFVREGETIYEGGASYFSLDFHAYDVFVNMLVTT